jgi:ferredoxin
VELGPENLPDQATFIHVDERTCVGCTFCAHVARGTFYIEPDHGKGRVHAQGADNDETIDEAIATCPVDSIHRVPWEELVELEKDREMNLQSTTPGRIIDEKYRTRSLADSRAPLKKFLVTADEQAAREASAGAIAEERRSALNAELGLVGVPDSVIAHVLTDPCESTLDCPVDLDDSLVASEEVDWSLFGAPVITDPCDEPESEACAMLHLVPPALFDGRELDGPELCGPEIPPDLCEVDNPPAMCNDPDGTASRIESFFKDHTMQFPVPVSLQLR